MTQGLKLMIVVNQIIQLGNLIEIYFYKTNFLEKKLETAYIVFHFITIYMFNYESGHNAI